jgi:hypothetical protein
MVPDIPLCSCMGAKPIEFCDDWGAAGVQCSMGLSYLCSRINGMAIKVYGCNDKIFEKNILYDE